MLLSYLYAVKFGGASQLTYFNILNVQFHSLAIDNNSSIYEKTPQLHALLSANIHLLPHAEIQHL